MASGFGYFHSSDNIVAGYGNIYVSGNITQSVDSTNRQVTITVQAFLTYYRRTGGNWNPGTSVLFENNTNGNYLRATLDGSSASDGTHLGLRGQNTTLVVGNYYDRHTGGVASWDISMITKSATFNYAASGAAITKSWSCSTSYGGTTLSLSGSVTTDSISASGTAPSNGYITGLSSIYYDGFPWIHADSAGVDNGGLTLTTLNFGASDRTYGASVPGRYVGFTNGGRVDLSMRNSNVPLSGDVPIVFNEQYYTGITAINSQGAYRYSGPTVVTVPAPAKFRILKTTADTAKIFYTTGIDNGFYSAKLQYSVDNGTTWVDATPMYTSTTERSGTFTVSDLTSGASNTIRVRTTTAAGSSESPSLTAVTKKAVLYGSVNGDSEKIIKLYGSVGGESKAIKKLYGSVNGRAKLIYKEN